MKVLFVSSMYHKPGRSYAGDKIHRLAVELARTGVELQVVCPLPRFERPTVPRVPRVAALHRENPLRVDGIPIWYMRFPNLPLGLLPGAHARILEEFLGRAIKRLRPSFPFQLIHAHRLFPTGYAAMRVAQATGVPFVVSAVGSDVHTHPSRNQGIRKRTRNTIRGSGAVLAVSRKLADQIEMLDAPRHPVRVVYRGVDAGRFAPHRSPQELRARLGLPSEGLGLCSVAHLIRPKGVMELLAAFRQLAGEFPELWLAIVGEGPLREQLESEVRAMGLKGRVFLPGSRPHHEVAEWMKAADVFVLASHNEGLPNVVLEAMACGLPVVATAVGGVPEAVEDGVTGHLVRPRDPELLIQSLRQVLNSELRRDMGTAGRARVESHFTWERGAEATRAAYEEVLAGHR